VVNSPFSFFKVGNLYITMISYNHKNEGEKEFQHIKVATFAICTCVTDYNATLYCQNDKSETIELVWDRHLHSLPQMFFDEVETVDSQ
jgi:hypothetical protein